MKHRVLKATALTNPQAIAVTLPTRTMTCSTWYLVCGCRYEEIMRARAQEEQQQQQVANKSSTSASAGGTQGLGQWVTALESWLQPRPGLNLLPRVRLPGSQHASPTTSQAPGTSNTRSSSKGQSSDSPSPAAGAGKAYQGRQAAANNIQAVIASSASGRGKGGASSTGGPGGPGASGPFDPSKDGPLTGPMLALPLLNSLSEQEWRAMEEAAVVAEAEQIKAAESGSSGGVGSKDKSEGESRARPAPVSHVGRVPLEVGYRVGVGHLMVVPVTTSTRVWSCTASWATVQRILQQLDLQPASAESGKCPHPIVAVPKQASLALLDACFLLSHRRHSP
jgi:hypothetical protein